MQTVIEVCDNYKDLLDYDNPNWLEYSVFKGTPLPKHHGRLVDIDKAEKEIRSYIANNKDSEDLFLAGCGDGAYHALITLKCATIIPATKEGDGE